MHACTKKVQELFEHFRVGHYSRQIMSNSEKPRTFLNFFLCTLPFLTSYYFSKKMKIATQQNQAFRAITSGFQRSNWTLSGPRLTKTMMSQIKTMIAGTITMTSQFLSIGWSPVEGFDNNQENETITMMVIVIVNAFKPYKKTVYI